MIYTFLWLTIFGGAAIKTERLAAKEGLCCPKWHGNTLGFNSTQVCVCKQIAYKFVTDKIFRFATDNQVRNVDNCRAVTNCNFVQCEHPPDILVLETTVNIHGIFVSVRKCVF